MHAQRTAIAGPLVVEIVVLATSHWNQSFDSLRVARRRIGRTYSQLKSQDISLTIDHERCTDQEREMGEEFYTDKQLQVDVYTQTGAHIRTNAQALTS